MVSGIFPDCASPTRSTRAGFCRWRFVMFLTQAGIVALNSMVWRCTGTASRMVSTSSENPMLSIMSASSRTTNRVCTKAKGRSGGDVHTFQPTKPFCTIPL